ncbi:MAG: OOP family OmpA-OmpF porin, partial [Bacteroidia bacterium]
LPYGEAYAFLGNVVGYYSINENIDLTEVKEYEEMNGDILMVPVEVGEVIRLNNIFFDFGKADLLDTSFPELDRVVKLLSEKLKISIELSGLTDNVGFDADNLKLSDDRTKSVVVYLIGKGIKDSRVLAKGYGESLLFATNDTEEDRLLNRRVGFKIMKI